MTRIFEAAFAVFITVFSALGLPTMAQEAPAVLNVAPSVDGKYTALSLSDGTIIVEETSNGEAVAVLIGHSELAIPVWNETGTQIVTVSTDLTARVWDIATGTQIHRLRRDDWIVGALWLNDALIYVSDNSVSGVLWDLSTGEVKDVPYGGWAFAFSPDRKHLAAARPSGYAVLDSSTLDEVYVHFERFAGEESLSTIEDREDVFLPVTAIAWQPNGNLIATGNTLGSVKLRDAMTGEIVHEWAGSESKLLTATDHFVKAVWFSSDGHQLKSVTEDGTLRRWDVSSGDLLAEQQIGMFVRSASFVTSTDQLVYVGYVLEETGDGGYERAHYEAEMLSFPIP